MLTITWMRDDMPLCDSIRSRVVRAKELARTQQGSDPCHEVLAEYMVLTFPEGHMSEEVGDEFLWLSLMQFIRVLDFVLLIRDDTGLVSVVELNDLSEMGGFSDIGGPIGGLIGEQDIERVSTRLDAGSAAALVLFEDLWAKTLSEVLNRSGALLFEMARVAVPTASWANRERSRAPLD